MGFVRLCRRGILCAVFLLPTLLLSPAAAGEESGEEPVPATAWGFGFRYGYFGFPNWLLDLLFEEHPEVDGTIAGAELRYYGDGGPSGAFSVGFSVDFGSSEGYGVWQDEEGDAPIQSGGEVDLIATAMTLYWDFFSSSVLHPYAGLGLGVGYAEGRYEREGERISVDEFVPVVHVPVGLVLNLGERFGLSIEARFIDGFSWGGLAQFRF